MTNYVSVQDSETGEIKNKLIPEEKREIDQDGDSDSHNGTKNNFGIRVAEMAVAAAISVGLHSLAYDYGDKYDNQDLSQHENMLELQMNQGINDVDFFNYFFRKLFYHCLSEHDEDNFKYTLFTSAYEFLPRRSGAFTK